MTFNSHNVELLLSVLGKMLVLVVAECSSSPGPPPIHPASSSSSSEQTDVWESAHSAGRAAKTTRGPGGLSAKSFQGGFSLRTTIQYPSLPTSFPSLPFTREIYSMQCGLKQSTTCKKNTLTKKSECSKKWNQNATHPQSILKLNQTLKSREVMKRLQEGGMNKLCSSHWEWVNL